MTLDVDKSLSLLPLNFIAELTIISDQLMVARDMEKDMNRFKQQAWQPQSDDALLIIDAQNDFLPGGSLSVPQGNNIIPKLNEYIQISMMHQLSIYATRDWHPTQHCSFHSQGGKWPIHCVAGTHGAEFPSTLKLPSSAVIVSKATTPEKDAYSGFQQTDLDSSLRIAGVKRLLIGGLATDFCVLNTVRDAVKLGYHVFLLIDAIRAIDAQPGDELRALDEMNSIGAKFTSLQQVAA
jgi:nicotinamidase/pyrazinamidase